MNNKQTKFSNVFQHIPQYLCRTKNLAGLFGALLLLLFVTNQINAQVLKADYQFQGNLNSSVAGAPTLTNLNGTGAANAFVNDTVDGISRQSLRFSANGGVAVNTTGLIPNNTYTIVILFKFDDVLGFRRVVDFQNRTSDDGAYIQNGRLEFEDTSNPQFQPKTYIQVVIVRESSGRIRAYRDGILRVDFPNDNGTFRISSANVLRFFQDDLAFPDEASAGNVARIRLYDAPLTTAQVQALDRIPAGTPPTAKPARSDFDGDGKSDYAVFRPSNGVWYLLNSTSGFSGVPFGIANDKLTPADYDGDGKTDIAVFRNGIWYLLQSKDDFKQTQFGQAGDVPVPADFDGDGKADLAVYRDGANGGQSFFYYLGSLNNPNKNITFIPFGSGGDKPVVGDYDGDGKTDPAVYRNGVWYLLRSQAGATAVQFGIATDKPTPADFDGDGKTDIAVYRKGVWYVLNSSDSQVKIVQFGLETDVPTVGDYDGDGKADFSVWRASNGVFYVLGSRAGFTAVQFGAGGDVPVASAYVP